MPVILATQEAEIRRIGAQSQPRQKVQETLSRKKKPFTKKGWWSGSSPSTAKKERKRKCTLYSIL
jgi:hypothetical protein